jgi:hypothetical protein
VSCGGRKGKKGIHLPGREKRNRRDFCVLRLLGVIFPLFFYFINIMITIIFRKTFSFSKKDLLWLMKSHKENPRQLPECRRFFSCYFHSSSPSLWGRVATTRGDTFAQTRQWEREPHNRKALFLYTSRSHSKGYLARCHTDVSFVFLSWGRLVEESLVGRCFFLSFPPVQWIPESKNCLLAPAADKRASTTEIN